MAVMRRAYDVALTALAPTVWGSTYAVTTLFLPPDRPLLAATIRALPSGLLLLLVGARSLPSTPSWWLRVLILGTLNIGAFFYFLFVAAYELPGGVAALVGSVQPLLVIVIAAWALRTAIRGMHIVACSIAMVGIALLVIRDGAGISAVGVIAALLAALSMASGIVLTKRWGRPPGVSVLTFTAWQLTAGGLVLAPVMFITEGLPTSLSSANIFGFVFLSVVGAMLAYVLWFRGIDRLAPVAVSFLGFFSPLTATVLGVLLLNELFQPLQIVGAVLVLLALVLVQRPPKLRGNSSLGANSVRLGGVEYTSRRDVTQRTMP